MKRLLALLLALMLPPFACSLAESRSVDYSVSFSMRAENDKVLEAIADLLNICTLDGSLTTSDSDVFDLYADLMLQGKESTRTHLHLYGNRDRWGIGASFLGNEQLRVENITLLEFCHKIANHMNISFQDVALLYPVCTELAFAQMKNAWTQTMCRTTGARTVSLKRLQALSAQLSDLSQSDRSFVYWLKSVAHQSSLESDFLHALSVMDGWLREHVDKNGLRVVEKDGVQRWTAKNRTFFEKKVENGVETAWLTLDDLPDSFSLQMDWMMDKSDDEAISGTFSLIFQQGTKTLLSLSGSLTEWPRSGIPLSGGSITLHTSGEMAGLWSGTSFSLHAHAAEEQSQQLDLIVARDNAELTASCAVRYGLPQEQTLSYTLPSLCLNTLNDDALSALITSAAPSAIRCILSLAAYAPASFCGAVMDFAEDAGFFEMLMPGASNVYID